MFTCVCGITDDAGWEPVSVYHDRDVVTWEFNHLELERFSFDREQYIAEIDRLNERLLDFSTFTIQPRYVTFPE